MKHRTRICMVLCLGLIAPSVALHSQSNSDLPRVDAELTFAPDVPPPVARKHKARVVVRLEATEQRGELTDNVEYAFWTFNGRVPGPFIRAREGDLLEIHLENSADSKNTHTVDFHAVTGTGGGAAALMTEPGKETVIEARALQPGLYVYHCAAPRPSRSTSRTASTG